MTSLKALGASAALAVSLIGTSALARPVAAPAPVVPTAISKRVPAAQQAGGRVHQAVPERYVQHQGRPVLRT